MEISQYIINAGYSIKNDLIDGNFGAKAVFGLLADQVVQELEADLNRLARKEELAQQELKKIQNEIANTKKAIEDLTGLGLRTVSDFIEIQKAPTT